MQGRVYWITGLSGAGKTTVATALIARLRESGLSPILLDGDRLRAAIAPDAGYDAETRKRLAAIYGRLCAELSSQGAVVVCATISMFHDIRDWNRANISGYREIYLRVQPDRLAGRDPKGLYKAAKADTLGNMVGIDQAQEEPRNPDLLIENDKDTGIEPIVGRIWRELIETDGELAAYMKT